MTRESKSSQAVAEILKPEVHLGEPNWRHFRYLVNYRLIASSLLSPLVQRRTEGLDLLEDKYTVLRLYSLNELVHTSARGINVPLRSLNGLSPITLKKAKDFEDITGLEGEMAKSWAARTTTVIGEVMASSEISVESAAFLESDVELFVERLITQPTERSHQI